MSAFNLLRYLFWLLVLLYKNVEEFILFGKNFDMFLPETDFHEQSIKTQTSFLKNF